MVIAQVNGSKGVTQRDFTLQSNKPVKAKPSALFKIMANTLGGEVKKHG